MLLEKCENVQYINKTFVGCNRCPACRNNKRNEWSIRLNHELIENGNRGAFITLTYNQENILVTADETQRINEYDEGGTLNKKDLQNFFKRLRKATPYKLKYIAAGEYGTLTKRPHYHIILLNITPEELEQIDVSKIWGKGHVDIDKRKIGGGCIAYINSYIKKAEVETKSDKLAWQKRYNRVPEFITQSQGIGKAWALNMAETWTQNCTIYLNKIRQSVPRYYIKTIKKMEGKTIKIKKKTRSIYKNITEENTYTYYKTFENPKGKYTARINEVKLSRIKELQEKLAESKIFSEQFIKNIKNNFINDLNNKTFAINKNITELEKENKQLITIPKFKFASKNYENFKKKCNRQMLEKFGINIDYYLKQSQSYNDLLRKKIDATARKMDKFERKDYYLKKKGLTNKCKHDIISLNLEEIGGLKNYEYFKNVKELESQEFEDDIDIEDYSYLFKTINFKKRSRKYGQMET